MEEEIIIYNNHNERLPVNKGDVFSGEDLIKNLNVNLNIEKYSLEPGGQIEWSSEPYFNLIDLS